MTTVAESLLIDTNQTRGSYAGMEVLNANEFQYAVIQFLDLPFAEVGDYVCVPHTWIRMRRATDRKILVLFPNEHPSKTKLRIERGEMASGNWRLYMAVVKHETTSYEDANNFILAKRNEVATANICSATTGTATATEGNSTSLKRTNLLDPQPSNKKNKVLNKTKFDSNSRNSSYGSPEDILEVVDQRSFPHQDQASSYDGTKNNTPCSNNEPYQNYKYSTQDLLPSYEDPSVRYPSIEGIPTKLNETHVSSPGIGSLGAAAVLVAPLNPLILENQIIQGSLQPQENQLLSTYPNNLHHGELTQRTHQETIPNHETFAPNVSVNLDHSSFMNVSPVHQEYPQVLPTEMAFVIQSSEAARTNNISDFQGDVIDTSVNCSNTSVYCGFPVQVSLGDKSHLHKESGMQAENITDGSSVTATSHNNARQSGQSVGSSIKRPTIDTVTTDDVLSSQDVDGGERSSSPEIGTEEILTASQDKTAEQTDKPGKSSKNMAEKWVDKFADLFIQMKCDSFHMTEIAYDIHKSLAQNAKVIECISNTINNLRENSKVTAVTSREGTGTEEVHKVAAEKDAEMKEKDSPDEDIDEKKKNCYEDAERNEDGDDDVTDASSNDYNSNNKDDVGDKEIQNTCGKRTFVLPPEYDPKDSRWTLKYRKKDPKLGLVELVAGSKVYINSIRLLHCTRVAKDYKSLARMLLVEIFSRSALSVCSLTGAQANAFHFDGKNVRPGLDEHARMALMAYVEDHGAEKKWDEFDNQSVINSMRCKIQEIRRSKK